MSEASLPGRSPLRVALAWGVHALTASGAVVGVVALLHVGAGRLREAALLMLVAFLIDSVDGTLARAARVAEVVPGVDGRRLDDIVDYLNYVIVPAVFMVAAGSVSHWIVAAAPVLASAYGFAQQEAKTEDEFFLGFPSFWNIVAIYLWGFEASPGVGTLWALGLSIAVFVPLKYVYPSHTRVLRRTTAVATWVWFILLVVGVAAPPPLGRTPLLLSTFYLIFYLGLSLSIGGLRRGDVRGTNP